MATGMVVARASKLTCMMPESLCVTGAVDEAVASVAGTTALQRAPKGRNRFERENLWPQG